MIPPWEAKMAKPAFHRPWKILEYFSTVAKVAQRIVILVIKGWPLRGLCKIARANLIYQRTVL